MDSSRLAAIDRLLEAALDTPPEERAAFLAAACGDDAELLSEVTSLVEAAGAGPGPVDGNVGSILRSPGLMERLRDVPTGPVPTGFEPPEPDHRSLIGQRLGTYDVLSLIAIGGMGEVYLADDQRMRRKVALKLLPSKYTLDSIRVLRFQREARAASALNHPGIVTVYEVGSESGIHFIASEYVEGETLRQRFRLGPMSVAETVEIGAQIAAALGAAHAAGLVHRDVKPENVMLRRDGYVKVLDFGLVKLIEAESDDLRTKLSSATIAGAVMGTVQYMAPEQARGEEVDARADLFALGVVLYEMLTGTSPFRGVTIATTFDAILNRRPAPIRALRSDVPEELERVVMCLLEKDRERRYGSAADARTDLLAVSRGVQSGPLLTPPSITGPVPAPSDAVHTTAQRRPFLRNRTAVALAIAAGLAVDATVLYLLTRPRAETGALRWQDAVVTKLTDRLGAELFPSLSADGSVLVYEARDGARSSIHVQRSGSKRSTNVTPELGGQNTQPAISPDGKTIVFRHEPSGGEDPHPGGLYVMAPDGGSLRRISPFCFNPAWSRDGKHIACAENSVDGAGRTSIPSRLYVLDAATGAARELAVRDAVQPSWSPDGRRIAFWSVGEGARRDIWTVSSDGGEAVPLTDDPFVDLAPAWAPSGGHVYFISNRKGALGLWRIAVDPATGHAKGAPELVPAPASKAHHVSLSADGKRIALGSLSSTQNIEVLTFDAPAELVVGEPRPVTLTSGEVTQPAVSRDGTLAYQSAEHPSDIFVCRPDEEAPVQITSGDTNDLSPRWSPDGRRLVFYSNRGGAYQIWTVDSEGGDPVRLTDAPPPGAVLPFFSPDGSRLAFSYFGGRTVLMTLDSDPRARRIDETASDPPRFTHFVAQSFSPDGKRLSGTGYVKSDRGSLSNRGLYLYDIASRKSEPLSPFGTHTRWLSDGCRILFVHQDKLLLADTSSKRTHEIYSATPRLIRSIDLSHDDRWIYASVESTEGDIWLLSLE